MAGYMRHPLNPRLVMTDGIVNLADKLGCWWLTDEIGIAIMVNEGLDEEPTFWALSARSRDKDGDVDQWLIRATDGGKGDEAEVVKYESPLAYCDISDDELPLRIWVFWTQIENGTRVGTLMLPEEY